MKVSKEVRRKGYLLFKKGAVKKVLETQKRIHFKVKGKTDVYSVIFDKEKGKFLCDCPWFSLKEKTCSHIYAVKLKEKVRD